MKMLESFLCPVAMTLVTFMPLCARHDIEPMGLIAVSDFGQLVILVWFSCRRIYHCFNDNYNTL